MLLGKNAITGEMLPIQLQHICISVCGHMYPCIMALLPLDDAARAVITSLSNAEGSVLNDLAWAKSGQKVVPKVTA